MFRFACVSKESHQAEERTVEPTDFRIQMARTRATWGPQVATDRENFFGLFWVQCTMMFGFSAWCRELVLRNLVDLARTESSILHMVWIRRRPLFQQLELNIQMIREEVNMGQHHLCNDVAVLGRDHNHANEMRWNPIVKIDKFTTNKYMETMSFLGRKYSPNPLPQGKHLIFLVVSAPKHGHNFWLFPGVSP